MSDFALRIEKLIRRLAAKKLNELVEETFNETMLFEKMSSAADSFVKSSAYSEMLKSPIKAMVMSGLIEVAVRELINADDEVKTLVRNHLKETVMEIFHSDDYHYDLVESLSEGSMDAIQGELQAKLIKDAEEAFETSLKAVTNKMLQEHLTLAIRQSLESPEIQGQLMTAAKNAFKQSLSEVIGSVLQGLNNNGQ